MINTTVYICIRWIAIYTYKNINSINWYKYDDDDDGDDDDYNTNKIWLLPNTIVGAPDSESGGHNEAGILEDLLIVVICHGFEPSSYIA